MSGRRSRPGVAGTSARLTDADGAARAADVDSGVRPTLADRVARRRVVRRRRLVALVIVGVVVVLAAAMILSHRSGDEFAGTWKGAGAGSLVVTRVNGADYTVVVGSAHKARTAVCSGDRLTIAAAAGVTLGAPPTSAAGTSSSTASSATTGVSAGVALGSSLRVIVLKPGATRGTLEECFADGTSTVLTRD